MTRRQIREQIFLLLFAAEFYSKDELEEQLAINIRKLKNMSDLTLSFSDGSEDSDPPKSISAGIEDSDPPKSISAGSEDAEPPEHISERDLAYIEEKVRDIISRLDEIDAQINAGAEGWKTTRMGKTELAIIRLAFYEMKYEEEIPVSVAINEAVELAKVYGSERGAAFVNGVLAKLA